MNLKWVWPFVVCECFLFRWVFENASLSAMEFGWKGVDENSWKSFEKKYNNKKKHKHLNIFITEGGMMLL